jgi:hypothetical protein
MANPEVPHFFIGMREGKPVRRHGVGEGGTVEVYAELPFFAQSSQGSK